MENKFKNIIEGFKFSARGLLTAIVCVIISVMLWLVVMWLDAPEYNKEIDIGSVVIIGSDIVADSDLECVSTSLDGGFEISVKGSKTALYDVLNMPSATYAAVDISTLAKEGSYSLKIDYRLPEGIEIVEAPEYVTVVLESAAEQE